MTDGGKRYNTGKPRFGLMPLHCVIPFMRPGLEKELMKNLAQFQCRQISAATLTARSARTLLDWQDLTACHFTAIEVLRSTARVWEFGAEKYDEWNWTKGMSWSAVIDCAARHLIATGINGVEIDPESGEPHVAHYLCNEQMLSFYQLHDLGTDDRMQILQEVKT